MKRLNYRLLAYISGLILVIESVFMLLCIPVSLIFGGKDLWAFVEAVSVTGAVGLLLFFGTRRRVSLVPGMREGFLAVGVSWIMISVFGTLPYVFSGSIPGYTDAWFESVSGFTTTGASILTDIEALSKEMLFWRSLTHWIGGMGIILMVIVILPSLKAGGTYLYSAEASKVSFEELRPRVMDTARRFGLIYLALTVFEVVLLVVAGMPVFDSLCHSFGTIATGGFGTKNTSIAGYSVSIQYIIIVFMFLSGINFNLHFLFSQGKIRAALRNEELKWYFRIILVFTLVIGAILFLHGLPADKAFRDSLFQVVSIITCTGFATADYMLWPSFAWFLIFILMFAGASAGSTGGGIKVVRHVLMMKNLRMEMKSLIHPRAIYGVKYQGTLVSSEQLRAVIAFYFWYMALFFASTMLMMFFYPDLETCAGSVATCMGGIGPGLGSVGPAANFFHLPWATKFLLTFDMIAGRFEIYAFLVLFSPAFWKS